MFDPWTRQQSSCCSQEKAQIWTHHCRQLAGTQLVATCQRSDSLKMGDFQPLPANWGCGANAVMSHKTDLNPPDGRWLEQKDDNSR